MLGGRLIPRELVPNDTEVIHMVAWSQCLDRSPDSM
jgi:hypothetical protein